MENKIESVLAALQQEEAQLQEQLKGVDSKVALLKTNLKRVQGAICELQGKPVKRKPKVKSAKGASRLPAATKAEVVEAITTIISDNGPVVEDDLKDLAEDRITRDGKSRMGFALRFKEALADNRLVKTARGIGLSSNASHG